MTTKRAYFHARSCAFVIYLIAVEPFTLRITADVRGINRPRRPKL